MVIFIKVGFFELGWKRNSRSAEIFLGCRLHLRGSSRLAVSIRGLPFFVIKEIGFRFFLSERRGAGLLLLVSEYSHLYNYNN